MIFSFFLFNRDGWGRGLCQVLDYVQAPLSTLESDQGLSSLEDELLDFNVQLAAIAIAKHRQRLSARAKKRFLFFIMTSPC